MKLFVRALLLCFPRRFRREYSGEWQAVAYRHAERIRATGSRLPALRTAAFLLRDAARSAPSAWWHTPKRRGSMSPTAGWGSPIRAIGQDARFALRSVKRRPWFATIAVLTLGLGIGTATAMFSVVNGVLLRPLQYRDSGQLVHVSQVFPHWRERDGLSQYWDGLGVSYPQYQAWRRAATSFDEVAIFHASDLTEMTLSGQGPARKLAVGVASASLLPTLGVEPFVGRNFRPEEEGPDAAAGNHVAMMSHEMWVSQFAQDPNVLGMTFVLDDEPFTVVGILPAGFRFRSLSRFRRPDLVGRYDVLIPVGASRLSTERGSNVYDAVGRLRSGVTLDQAAADVQASLLEGEPVTNRSARLERRRAEEVGALQGPLWWLLGATGLLLLIGCGNLAVLSLSEAGGRRRELVARQALGASRHRIARQLVVESLVLGCLGSVLGLSLATIGLQALTAIGPPLPRLDEIGVDANVVAFAVGVGLLTGLVFGTAPALLSTRRLPGVPAHAVLDHDVVPEGVLHRRLIAAELALTVVLLVPATLLVKSHLALQAVDAGFQPAGLATVHLSLPETEYATPEARAALVSEAVTRVAALPDVSSATAADSLPFPGTRVSTFTVEIDGAGGRWTRADPDLFKVWPGYHETAGIGLRAGRTFGPQDSANAPPVVVIDESFARQHWPTGSPIGDVIRYRDRLWTIVGVVGGVRLRSLADAPRPTLYVPMPQDQPTELDLVARSGKAEASTLPGAMTRVAQALDPDVPVTGQATVEGLVTASTREERSRALLLSLFGTLAAGLAGIGVFSIVARGVSCRRHELGIRMAMGATAASLVAAVLRTSLQTGFLGAACGALVALWTSRFVGNDLFGIDASDPLTYGSVVLACLALTFVATLIPASRIAGIDPARTLRDE